jgi:hypothetical protein
VIEKRGVLFEPEDEKEIVDENISIKHEKKQLNKDSN